MKFLAVIGAGLLAMAAMLPIAKKPVQSLSLQETRWNTSTIKTSKQSEVRWIAKQIKRNETRYQALEDATGVKWQIIACLHNMECGLRFDQHLHNGDSLTKRTWQVPAGRPKTGNPPFTFEVSAIDALQYDRMDKVDWDDVTKSLDALEAYNGLGYKKYHPTVPTPYLWSGTSIYNSGKYVQDGKWSSTAVSSQIGICSVLKELNFKWN